MRCKRVRIGKAGTSVIEATLMMLVTMAALSLALGGTYRFISYQRGEAGAVDALRERVVVEDLWFRTENGVKVVTVYVRNIGDDSLKIVSVEANGTRVTILGSASQGTYPQTVAASNLELVPLQGGWITADFNWEAGKKYQVAVVTLRGSSFGGEESA